MKDCCPLSEELLAHISSLWIIDTHEHAANYKSGPLDYLALTVNCYARLDLRSAGMPLSVLDQVRDASRPVTERWLLCEPYWNACRNTGYIRMHERVARDVYGVEGVNRDSIEQLHHLFQQKDPSHSYAEGHRQSQILCSIVDSDMDCDRSIQRPAFRLEEFVERIELGKVRQLLGSVGIRTFTEWLDACEEVVRRYRTAGAVAFKTTIATDRTLAIGHGSYAEAESSFLEAVRENTHSFSPSMAYQDFMFHHVLGVVRKLGLTVQMHTGMSASNANVIPNGNPLQLCELFAEYPDVDFVIMHMGFPYQLELSALGKMFPNVYPDLSWAHILSPHAARLALSDWLDAMPATKIMGFGGDCGHEDAIHAHLLMARENISHVLAQKVQEGCFDMAHAKWIAEQLLIYSPYRVFRLADAGVTLHS